MPNIPEWIAELTDERQREEAAAKEAAKVHLQRVEAIDRLIAQLQQEAPMFDFPAASGANGIIVEPKRQPVLALVEDGEPYWKWAVDAYEAAGNPMRMPALSREIEKRGGPKIHRESLRTIIRGKSDIFVNCGDGYYGLAAWPEDRKAIKLEDY